MKYSESLKKNRDFKTVYGNGKSRANKYLVMYVMKNGTEKNRIGISVSKKVGNSVVRHHLTRLIREIYRLNEHHFKKGLDIIFIVRVNAKKTDYHTLEKALMHVADIHRVLEKSRNEQNEQNFNSDDQILQKIYLADEKGMLYLYSDLFAVCN